MKIAQESLKLEKLEWKEFKIGDIFTEIKRGKRLIEQHRVKGKIPYYSASKEGNGLTDFINNPLFVEKDKLIVTTFCDSYYVSGIFTASDEITMLGSDKLNKYIGLFLANIIRNNAYKFAFGYKAFTERIKRQIIKLPTDLEGNPNWEFMESYMRNLEHKHLEKITAYYEAKLAECKGGGVSFELEEYKNFTKEPIEWKEFKISKLFTIVDGYYNKKPPLDKNGTIPFLGATQYNNGITAFYSKETIFQYDKVGNISLDKKQERIFKGNCIAITNDGSVGMAYYQQVDFACSHSVTTIYLKNKTLNSFIASFLIVSLQRSGKSFEYAKKWRPKRMRSSKIMLPTDLEGNPNWEFMENYMRNLEHKHLEKITAYYEAKLKDTLSINSHQEENIK